MHPRRRSRPRKTIEAGLIISQLMAEGMRRVLLVVPKSLLGQWQTELVHALRHEAREGRLDPEALRGTGVFLTHRELAGGTEGRIRSEGGRPVRPRRRRRGPRSLFGHPQALSTRTAPTTRTRSSAQTAGRLREVIKRSGSPVVLLTATPIQNSLAELWGLVQYVEPTGTLLGRLPTFREVFCETGDRAVLPEQARELRRRLQTVLQRTLRRQAQEFLQVPFVERHSRVFEYAMSAEEQALVHRRHRVADARAPLRVPRESSATFFSSASIAEWRRRSPRWRRASSVWRSGCAIGWRDAAIPSRTTARSSCERWRPILEEDERLGAAEDDDDAEAPPVEAESAVSETDEGIRAELEVVVGIRRTSPRAWARQQGATTPRGTPIHPGPGIAGVGLRQGRDLHRVVDDAGLPAHAAAGTRLRAAATSRCFAATTTDRMRSERWSNGRRTRDTRLPPAHRPSRDVAIRLALVHEFKHRSKVFISTEAGAKGLNLQFCDTVINYDLPWNPQRIEQRIGRVHRYGQKRGVTVISFLAAGNVAQRLTLEILTQKLDLFGKVLDASDAVLYEPSHAAPESLVASVGVDFEKELRVIYGRARSIDDVTADLQHLRDTMESRRRAFDEVQERASGLIETRLDDAVRQVLASYQSSLPSELEGLDRDVDLLTQSYFDGAGISYVREQQPGRVAYQVQPSPPCRRDIARALSRASATRATSARAKRCTSATPWYRRPSRPRGVRRTRRLCRVRSRCESARGCARARGTPRQAGGHTRRRIGASSGVDNLLVTAVLDGESDPLPTPAVGVLLASPVREVGPSLDLPEGQALQDAIDTALLRSIRPRFRTQDQARFEQMLRQLDHYLSRSGPDHSPQGSGPERSDRGTQQKRSSSARVQAGDAMNAQLETLIKERESCRAADRGPRGGRRRRVSPVAGTAGRAPIQQA